VLGDMLELGPDERRFHAELGREVSRLGVEVLITVGPLAREIAVAAQAPPAGGETPPGPVETHVLPDAATAAGAVSELLAPGDVVLVKGSNGVGLALVCQALRERLAP
jgi:UDP-N-acetylmuramyl pentapeptide synthase